jgi:hypothetical protein
MTRVSGVKARIHRVGGDWLAVRGANRSASWNSRRCCALVSQSGG